MAATVGLVRLGLCCVFLAACDKKKSEPTVADLLDALYAKIPNAKILPGAQREAELHPGAKRDILGPRGGDIQKLLHKIYEIPESRKVRARGPALVPELVRLLQNDDEDQDRRVAAAYVLARIGGEPAARAMWDVFERLLLLSDKFVVVRVDEAANIGDLGEARAMPVDWVDLMGELRHGLCIAGRPVVPEMVSAASAALAAMAALSPEQREVEIRQESPERSTEHYPKPVQDAKEMLSILGWVGDDRAVPVFAEALKYTATRRSAMFSGRWLASPKLLPHLLPFLEARRPPDDRADKDAAVYAAAFILDRREFHKRPNARKIDLIAINYVRRIRTGR